MRNPRIIDGFGQVSNTVLRDPDISLREKALYSYLCTYANNATNQLTVGVSTMAAECGIDESTIKRLLRQLEKKGIIIRTLRGYKQTKITTLLK